MMMLRCGMLFYIYKYLYYTMISCDDEAMRWLSAWYMYIYIYIMILWWWYVMRTWWCYVVLRAPMDDLWQRSHMGRWCFHSTEAIWGMIAREEWLGCRHDASPMLDIPGLTPVWAQCILFSGFQDIKTYVYVYYFQNLYVV